MSIKLLAGRFYRDRNGVLHGPLKATNYPLIKFEAPNGVMAWCEDGKYRIDHGECSWDLVVEEFMGCPCCLPSGNTEVTLGSAAGFSTPEQYEDAAAKAYQSLSSRLQSFS